MPTYHVQTSDGRVVRIPAADSGAALRSAQQWATANPVPVSGPGLAKSFGSGVINGVTSLGNLMHPGGDPDYLDLAQRGGQWAAQHLGGQSATQAQTGYDQVAAARRALIGPTSTEAQQDVHLYHAPQNEAEQIADTTGAFVPNAFLGGGGWLARGARVAMPAATSEGARYAVEKTGGGPVAQALASLAGNAMGNAFAHPNVPSSLLPASSEARATMSAGIPLTWGQQMGGAAKQLEDHFVNYPVLGPAIDGARKRGVEAFNRALANAALEPLGQSLPANVAVGPDMVTHIQNALDAAKLAAGKTVGEIKEAPYFQRMVESRLYDLEGLPEVHLQSAGDLVHERIIGPIQRGEVNGDNVFDFQDKISDMAGRFVRGKQYIQQVGDALNRINHDMTNYIDGQYDGYADTKARFDFTREMLQNIGVSQDHGDEGGPRPIAPMRLLESMQNRYGPGYEALPTPAGSRASALAQNANSAFGQAPAPDPTATRVLGGGGMLAFGMSPALAAKPLAGLGLSSLPYLMTGRSAPNWFANVKPNFVAERTAPPPLPLNAIKLNDFKPLDDDAALPANPLAKAPGVSDSTVVPFIR